MGSNSLIKRIMYCLLVSPPLHFFLSSSLSLSYTQKSGMSHRHRTITQAHTQKKTLLHTRTYTKTHLHSAAVSKRIQCLSADKKNIQYWRRLIEHFSSTALASANADGAQFTANFLKHCCQLPVSSLNDELINHESAWR